MDYVKLHPQDMDMELVTELTGTVIGKMLDMTNGDHDQLPWDHAIFAVGLAVKAFAGIATHDQDLTGEQLRDAVMGALGAALMIDVQSVRADSVEELEEIKTAMEQSSEGPRH